jgi:hypothetical protein
LFDDPGDEIGPKSCDLWKPVIAAVNGIACMQSRPRPASSRAGAVRALWMALELSRKQALDMGYSLIRIGSDPANISGGQDKFAGGQRVEPSIR